MFDLAQGIRTSQVNICFKPTAKNKEKRTLGRCAYMHQDRKKWIKLNELEETSPTDETEPENFKKGFRKKSKTYEKKEFGAGDIGYNSSAAIKIFPHH